MEITLDSDLILEGENLDVLPALPDGAFDLIYIDPPFNTGRAQVRTTLAVSRDEAGERTGFGGHRYRAQTLRSLAFGDEYDDYLDFLAPRLEHARRLLADHGTLYFHIDYREAHYCKVLLDEIFGRKNFLNEIIWAYDYGAKPKTRWPAKHDTILVYVKDRARYHFDAAAVEREPYMAPGLVDEEKRARGKLPTDCYSADTDVLTRRGWIPFPQVTENDELATVSPEGDLHYAHPTAVHARPYEGSMRRFKSRTVDLLVTPRHSMLVKPKHRDEYEFRLASDLDGPLSSYYALRNHLRWPGLTSPPTHAVPRVRYDRAYCAKPLPEFQIEDWCEFVGWYLAEGSTTFYADRTEVHISQIKHADRVERIGGLLARMGLRAWYSGRTWVVANRQLAEWTRTLGKTHEKRIPRDLLDLPREPLLRLYEGLMLGDGYRRKRGAAAEELYTTVSPGLADDVQELMMKLGNNASIARTAPVDPGHRTKYVVHRRVSRESTIWPARHAEEVDYRGTVHCATVVPHHTLVVRRNGRAAVCGNCWWHTIVPTTSREKTGYPTQKPEGVVRRIVAASSRPDGWCLDFFAGSGTLGAVCAQLGRRYVLVDSNPEAIRVARERLARQDAGA